MFWFIIIPLPVLAALGALMLKGVGIFALFALIMSPLFLVTFLIAFGVVRPVIDVIGLLFEKFPRAFPRLLSGLVLAASIAGIAVNHDLDFGSLWAQQHPLHRLWFALSCSALPFALLAALYQFGLFLTEAERH